MTTFLAGFFSSLAATGFGAVVMKFVWPEFQDRILYKGIRVDGSWNILEEQKGRRTKAGQLELKQSGRRITGTSIRSKRRDGTKSDRQFKYKGCIDGNQVTLLFEDARGIGFDTGSYIFVVQNDGLTMVGMATFHGKLESKIVSEPRTLEKMAS